MPTPNMICNLFIGPFRIGCSPTPVAGKGGDDAYPVIANPSDEDASCEVTDEGNDQYSYVFTASGRRWSQPPIQDITTPSLGQTRDASISAGGWEKQWTFADPTNDKNGVAWNIQNGQTTGIAASVVPQ